jgi:hypothetical protein
MSKTTEYRAALVLAAALAGPSMLSGGVTKVCEAEQPANHWDDREDAAYRRYLAHQHQECRGYSRLNLQAPRGYWGWRHPHPG